MSTYLLQQRRLILGPQLLQMVVLFLLEVGLLLDLSLVQAVHDGVLALGDEDPLHL